MKLTLKGSPTSGWFSPPKGTHSGEEHREVGSGKAIVTIKKPTTDKVDMSNLPAGTRVKYGYHSGSGDGIILKYVPVSDTITRAIVLGDDDKVHKVSLGGYGAASLELSDASPHTHNGTVIGNTFIKKGIDQQLFDSTVAACNAIPEWARDDIYTINASGRLGPSHTVGGHKFNATGDWGSDGGNTINLYHIRSRNVVVRVLRHEIGHAVHGRLNLDASTAERKVRIAHPEWLTKKGTVRKASQAQYNAALPKVAKIRNAFQAAWRAGDGVTSYSKSWSKHGTREGIDETFAELSKMYFGSGVGAFSTAGVRNDMANAYMDIVGHYGG